MLMRSSDLMQTLPVNEFFETVQGEATFTGMPSTFVRLQRCDVGCPWCDTKYTWDIDPVNVDPLDAASAGTTAPRGKPSSARSHPARAMPPSPSMSWSTPCRSRNPGIWS
jgi:hypothetical protein